WHPSFREGTWITPSVTLALALLRSFLRRRASRQWHGPCHALRADRDDLIVGWKRRAHAATIESVPGLQHPRAVVANALQALRRSLPGGDLGDLDSEQRPSGRARRER